MKNLNVHVLVCLNDRPHIANLALQNIQGLETAGLNIEIFAGTSSVEDQWLAILNNVFVISSEATTVGQKWNDLASGFIDLVEANDLVPDYVFISGDDNLYSSDFLTQYLPYMRAGVEALGVDRLFIVDGKSGNSIEWVFPPDAQKVVGAGRCVRYDVFKRCGAKVKCLVHGELDVFGRKMHDGDVVLLSRLQYNYFRSVGKVSKLCDIFAPWDPARNRSLDFSLDISLLDMAISTTAVRNNDTKMLDFKGGRNINSFSSLNVGTRVDIEAALSFCSEQEKRNLKILISREKNSIDPS
jgi:hypothetical protein